jgi:hypothetical protein
MPVFATSLSRHEWAIATRARASSAARSGLRLSLTMDAISPVENLFSREERGERARESEGPPPHLSLSLYAPSPSTKNYIHLSVYRTLIYTTFASALHCFLFSFCLVLVWSSSCLLFLLWSDLLGLSLAWLLLALRFFRRHRSFRLLGCCFMFTPLLLFIAFHL